MVVCNKIGPWRTRKIALKRYLWGRSTMPWFVAWRIAMSSTTMAKVSVFRPGFPKAQLVEGKKCQRKMLQNTKGLQLNRLHVANTTEIVSACGWWSRKCCVVWVPFEGSVKKRPFWWCCHNSPSGCRKTKARLASHNSRLQKPSCMAFIPRVPTLTTRQIFTPTLPCVQPDPAGNASYILLL